MIFRRTVLRSCISSWRKLAKHRAEWAGDFSDAGVGISNSGLVGPYFLSGSGLLKALRE